MLTTVSRKSLVTFLPRDLHFHFVLDSAKYVARFVQIVVSAIKEIKPSNEIDKDRDHGSQSYFRKE